MHSIDSDEEWPARLQMLQNAGSTAYFGLLRSQAPRPTPAAGTGSDRPDTPSGARKRSTIPCGEVSGDHGTPSH